MVAIGLHVSVVDRLCSLDLGVKGSTVCTGCLYQFSCSSVSYTSFIVPAGPKPNRNSLESLLFSLHTWRMNTLYMNTHKPSQPSVEVPVSFTVTYLLSRFTDAYNDCWVFGRSSCRRTQRHGNPRTANVHRGTSRSTLWGRQARALDPGRKWEQIADARGSTGSLISDENIFCAICNYLST
eukprot:COSAG01_NODE_16384_length_1240_cov_2.010517_2_plen_181_part_00